MISVKRCTKRKKRNGSCRHATVKPRRTRHRHELRRKSGDMNRSSQWSALWWTDPCSYTTSTCCGGSASNLKLLENTGYFEDRVWEISDRKKTSHGRCGGERGPQVLTHISRDSDSVSPLRFDFSSAPRAEGLRGDPCLS